MLAGAFLQNLQLNRIINGMAIGLNVYTEADEIVRWLGRDSKYIAGDFFEFRRAPAIFPAGQVL